MICVASKDVAKKMCSFHNPTGIACMHGGVHLWEVVFKIGSGSVCMCKIRNVQV